MMTRFLAIAACVLAGGCGGGGGGGGGDADSGGSTQQQSGSSSFHSGLVSMTLRPASIVPNLQQLTLRLQPLGFHNLSGTEQVLTDAAGNDGVYHQECGYQDMFGRICKDVRNYLDVDLFNTQQRDPLNTRLVVNANMVPAGQYIGVTMYFTDVSNQRDSYAILANGAECEVRVEPISYQDWTMRVVENSAVGYEIVVDFSENVVSPTEDCADGPLTLTGKIVGLTRTH